MSALIGPGYKQTEVGVIPNDWEVLFLSEVLRSFQNGFAFSSGGYVDFGIPIVTMAQIGLNGSFQYNEKNMNFWPDSQLEKLSAFHLFNGDLLIAMTDVTPEKNLIGRMAAVSVPGPLLLNQRVGLLRINKEKISPGFLREISNSKVWRSYSKAVATQGVQANIGKKEILAGFIPIPPFQEQLAIASSLANVDTLISALDKLIVKKRDIQQATMQQLLIGQRRLPGFSEQWNVKPMRALGNTYGGLTGKTKINFGHGEARYIPFMNVMTDTVIDANWLEPVDVAQDEAQNLAKKGDLFFNGSSETPEEVGFCSVLLEDIPNLYLNSFCFGFRFNTAAQVNGLFFAFWFRSNAGRAAMSVLAQGATRYNISKSAFMQLEIPQPSEAEQTAIATILSDMKTEISVMETRRDKVIKIKEGMMQSLLTGKVRLKN